MALVTGDKAKGVQGWVGKNPLHTCSHCKLSTCTNQGAAINLSSPRRERLPSGEPSPVQMHFVVGTSRCALRLYRENNHIGVPSFILSGAPLISAS